MFREAALGKMMMGECVWRRVVSLSLRLMLVIPAGLPVRSQGDTQSDNTVMDNITVRQGETVLLRYELGL